MKRWRGIAFNLACLISLTLAIALAAMGARSLHDEFRFRYNFLSNRYMLKASRGQWVIMGVAPGDPSDRTADNLATQMSDADFDWEPPIWRNGQCYVQGNVRRESPTARMYDRYRDRLRDDSTVGPPLRAWARALEDPGRRVPAMMLLSFPAGWWRIARVSDDGVEHVTLAADPATGKPDLSHWTDFRERWHDARDVPLFVLFAGVPVLLVLVLPLAWIAQPRWERRTLGRLVFNAAAIVSTLIFGVAIAAWVRSYAGETWVFTPRRLDKPPVQVPTIFAHDVWFAGWSVVSGAGRLQVLRLESPGPPGQPPSSIGYRPRAQIRNTTTGSRAGARRLPYLGIKYDSSPPQMRTPGTVSRPAAPNRWPVTMFTLNGQVMTVAGATTVPTGATQVQTLYIVGPPNPPAGPALWAGVRSLLVSWWVIVLATAILPAIWLRGPWFRYRNRGRNLCPECGYDIRFTPDRCPECGTAMSPGGGLGRKVD